MEWKTEIVFTPRRRPLRVGGVADIQTDLGKRLDGTECVRSSAARNPVRWSAARDNRARRAGTRLCPVHSLSDREERKGKSAFDHAPVVVDLDV